MRSKTHLVMLYLTDTSRVVLWMTNLSQFLSSALHISLHSINQRAVFNYWTLRNFFKTFRSNYLPNVLRVVYIKRFYSFFKQTSSLEIRHFFQTENFQFRMGHFEVLMKNSSFWLFIRAKSEIFLDGTFKLGRAELIPICSSPWIPCWN